MFLCMALVGMSPTFLWILTQLLMSASVRLFIMSSLGKEGALSIDSVYSPINSSTHSARQKKSS
jgi:hypothetical protein